MDKNNKLTPEEEFLIYEAYRDYHKDLYLYVTSHSKYSLAAEDIISETFALACEKIETFKKHTNKKAWLFRTAHFKILELRRRLRQADLIYTENMTKEPADPSTPYTDKELNLTVRDILTSEEYLLFRRYFLWGYSLKETAALENVSEGYLSVKLSRLRRKLRDAL